MCFVTSSWRFALCALALLVVACNALLDPSALTDGASEPSGGASAGALSSGGSAVGGAGSGGDPAGAGWANAGSVATSGAPAGGGTGGDGVGGQSDAAGAGGAAGDGGEAGDAGHTGGCSPNGTAEACDGLDNDCNPATPDQCPTGCLGQAYQAVGYMACSTELSFAFAEAQCEAQAMRLVKIDNAAENAFVLSRVKTYSLYVWIGGAEQANSNSFRWLDGTVIFANGVPAKGVYQNFGSGEPANEASVNCLQLTRGPSPPPGMWSTAACADTQPFVCERY